MQEEIVSGKDLKKLKNNRFIGNIPKMKNTTILFKGKNNILFIEDGVILENSKINFSGNNSIVYLSTNKHIYNLDIAIYCNSVLFIGNNNYFNGLLHLIASEERNIIIGNDCLFSYNINIRVSDAHSIYSSVSHNRLNNSRNVYIGDHCWIGFGSYIFKGCKIGSGSIIGAASVLSNKLIFSNTSFAGNPAKLISKDVFFTKDSVNNYIDVNVSRSQEYLDDEFVYEDVKEEKLSYKAMDKALAPHIDIDKKLKWIQDNLVNNTAKNRFFIAKPLSKKQRIINKIKRVLKIS